MTFNMNAYRLFGKEIKIYVHFQWRIFVCCVKWLTVSFYYEFCIYNLHIHHNIGHVEIRG